MTIFSFRAILQSILMSRHILFSTILF